MLSTAINFEIMTVVSSIIYYVIYNNKRRVLRFFVDISSYRRNLSTLHLTTYIHNC